MNYLIIVESPNKEKTIKKYLSDEYEVLASVGHIVKMSTSGDGRLGIDFENWEPKYSIDPIKKDVVEKLRKHAKKADIVYIATDLDREGEAIGDNLVEFLNIKDKYKRIRYNEITKEAVLSAIANPSVIDDNLVKAQKSRRMLDRIIGFKLTNLIKTKLSNYPIAPTAGRVQSIALKLVVDRENEIKSFIPVKYHTIDAIVNDEITATYFNPENKEIDKNWILPEHINEIYNSLKGPLVVDTVTTSIKNDASITPLKQAVLYRKADMSSKSTQSALQKLYEGFGDGGLISYPRTDSTRLSIPFLLGAKSYIKKVFGPEYVSETIKGIAGDQDAHEAIRPTDIGLTPQKAMQKYSLSSAENKIYSLIYYITMQAIMTVPKREIIRYNLKNSGHFFKLTSSKVIFDGYLKLKKYEASKELPKYKKDEIIHVKEYINNAHETKPPSRFNDGSLIQKLDEIKVGRPSTFATTISKIIDRKFVEKEGKALQATKFGEEVIKKLIEGFPNEITEGYTARVEADLDLIAEGKIDYKFTMEQFWNRFNESYKTAELTLEKTILIPRLVGELCELDQGQLIYKNSRKNEEFIGCINFPECTFTKNPATKKRFSFLKKLKK
ncbi:MAG: type I DNA topoisomerase [Mycoplasmataceae bacterium]|nr:type I DNA topoisomerase [Mycoplasmataceae bacterium]